VKWCTEFAPGIEDWHVLTSNCVDPDYLFRRVDRLGSMLRGLSKRKTDKKIHPPASSVQAPPTSPIQCYIGSVIHSSNDVHSQIFLRACCDFQRFVDAQFQNNSARGLESGFLSNLATCISMDVLKDPHDHFLLLSLLLDVNLGSVSSKATILSVDIKKFQPSQGESDVKRFERTFQYFGRVLVWLQVPLKTSLQLYLQPLKANIVNWNQIYPVHSLLLARFFLTNFAWAYVSDMPILIRQMKQFLQHENQVIVSKYAVGVVATVFSLIDYPNYSSQIRALHDDLLSLINNPDWFPVLNGTPITVNALCEVFSNPILTAKRPEFAKLVTLKRDVFNALWPKAAQSHSHALLRVVPLRLFAICYRHCRDDFSADPDFVSILRLFYERYDESREKDQVAKAIGEFCFLVHPSLLTSEKVKEEVRNLARIICRDKKITEFGLYALLSLCDPNLHGQSLYNQILPRALQNPLNSLILEGFARLVARNPRESTSGLRHQVFPHLITAVLTSGDEALLRVVLKALRHVAFDQTYFTFRSLCQIGRLLSHSDHRVRKESNLLLCQLQKDFPEVSVLISAAIAIEPIEKLRVAVVRQVQISNELVLNALRFLLYDPQLTVASETLILFCREPAALSTVTCYVTDLIGQLNQTDVGNIRIVTALSIVLNSHPHIIQPFTSQLIQEIFEFESQSAVSLNVLTHLMPHAAAEINLKELVTILKECLQNHANIAIILSALRLASSAMKYLDFGDHTLSILVQIINLSAAVESSMDLEPILRLLSQIGPVRLKTFHAILSKDQKVGAPVRRVEFGESLDQLSVTIPLAITFETLLSPSLTALHEIAICSLIDILKCGPIISDNLLARIVETISSLMQSESSSLVIKEFPRFLDVAHKQIVEPILPAVMDTICRSWSHTDCQFSARAIEKMAARTPKLFAQYMPRVTELLMNSILLLEDRESIYCAVKAIEAFGPSLKRVDYLIIPKLLILLETRIADETMADSLLPLFLTILRCSNIEKYCVSLVQTMARLVSVVHHHKDQMLDILFVLLVNLKDQFIPFLSFISTRDDITGDGNFVLTVQCVQARYPLPTEIIGRYGAITDLDQIIRPSTESRRKPTIIDEQPRPVKPQLPQPGWDHLDWNLWFTSLVPLYLSESSSRAIRTCVALSERNFNVRRILFPLSYARSQVTGETQSDVMETVLSLATQDTKSPDLKKPPSSIVRQFLSVAEMQECAGIETQNCSLLAQAALSVGEYAQALRYCEYLYRQTNPADQKKQKIIEDLIFLNQNLSLPVSAQAMSDPNSLDNPLLAEKLGDFEAALQLYRQGSDPSSRLGCLNCLEKLGRFRELSEMTEDEPSLFGASAAWYLDSNEQFARIVPMLSDNSPRTLFFQAYLKATVNQIDDVFPILERIRKKLVTQMFPLISQDYDRAYTVLCFSSLVFTLEEILLLRQWEDNLRIASTAEQSRARSHRQKLLGQWRFKVHRCQDSPLAMFDLIKVLSLGLTQEQLKPFYLQFLKRNLKNPSSELNDVLLNKLDRNDPDTKAMIAIQKWAIGERREANEILSNLLLADPTSFSVNQTLARWLIADDQLAEARKPLKRLIQVASRDVGYWDLWSFVNYQLFLRLQSDQANPTQARKRLITSFEASLNGLALDPAAHSRFTMRVIKVLFDCKEVDSQVNSLFSSRLPQLPPPVWVSMLPQIIARLGYEPDFYAFNILVSIAESQPHAVLYSLLPPSQSDDEKKRKVVMDILARLRSSFPGLVNGTLQFQENLMEIGATWWERWQIAIDQCSRSFVKESLMERTVELLLPLHEAMNRCPKSFYELSFLGQYGAVLANGRRSLELFKATRNEMCFHKAWDFYAFLFRTNKIFLPAFKELDLADASPYLAELRNSPLIVPGTFECGKPRITIQSIARQVPIMSSKMRPKKMSVIGSDGRKYQFLLKSNEDTRLDERAMQILDFISRVINTTDIPFNSRLTLTTYKVVPLTAKIGLIGWVPDCETLAHLIVSYRAFKNMSIQTEKTAVRSIRADSFEAKLAAFESGLRAHPRDDDLQKVLVMLSSDSADWLQRRLNYTTSLASTSMSGYILGLGDRHLQNIMMKKSSSKLVHIDFGDCFEVAMTREVWPEKVPFRLTRMLVGALEVAGVAGIFRDCCEDVMTIMRDNEEQISGFARALIDDPLIKDGKEKTNGNAIWTRIRDKLTGRDFEKESDDDPFPKTVRQQCEKLVHQATNKANLCQMYIGWVPHW
jgi:FKBP12-rapamycin complex-associated protein